MSVQSVISSGVESQGKERCGMKPAYIVPTMREIDATQWNNRTVASLFSGCGGSSLGYKMSGFRVAYANEFIEAAAEIYRINHSTTFVDTRDIREVKCGEVLDILNMKVGQLDLLDGSPPCASFSMAGLREDGWNKVRKYSDSKQRSDDLFNQFARILKGLQPKMFVAENVAGLVHGKARGMFLEILAMLKQCGYKVRCKILDAQWLGVPQRRTRTIFIGIRNDLHGIPEHPKPLPYNYTVGDIFPNILDATAEVECKDNSHALMPCLYKEWHNIAIGKHSERYFQAYKLHPQKICPTIVASVTQLSCLHPVQPRSLTISELKKVCSFPADFILTGPIMKQHERLGRAVPPVMMSHIARTAQRQLQEMDQS